MRVLIFLLAGLMFGSATAAEFKCNASPFETSAKSDHLLSVDEMRSEIDCMVDILRNVHPHLSVHTKPKTFQRLARAVKNQISAPETIENAHSRYLKLISAVCDEHTIIRLAPEVEQNWPFGNNGFGVRLFVVGGTLYGQLPVGRTEHKSKGEKTILEIQSIDGVTATEIRDFIISQTIMDACATNRDLLLPHAMMQRFLTRFFGAKPAYRVSAKSNTGEVHNYLIPGTSVYETFDQFAKRPGTSSYPLYRDGFHLRKSVGGWRYLVHEADGIGYLFTEDFAKIGEAQIELIMGFIIDDNPDKLIVDLSSNPGGMLRKSMLMNSFLIPRAHRPADFVVAKRHSFYRPGDLKWEADSKALRDHLRQFRRVKRRGGLKKLRFRTESFGNPSYRGQLYVLVSHRTGSSAVSSAFVLKRFRKGTTIMGSQTHGGGKYGCMSAQSYYELPYSKMRFYVPRTCHSRQGKLANRHAKAIIPDVSIVPQIGRLDEFGKALMLFALDYVKMDGRPESN